MKSLKTKTGGMIIFAVTVIAACGSGSQVVEFGKGNVGSPDGGDVTLVGDDDDSTGDDDTSTTCTCHDAGTPEGDSGLTETPDSGNGGGSSSSSSGASGGSGGHDAGTSGGGGNRECTSADSNKTCVHLRDCCEASCKTQHPVLTCPAGQSCLTQCESVRKTCDRKGCQSTCTTCSDRCSSEEHTCGGRATCDSDRGRCTYLHDCCTKQCGDDEEKCEDQHGCRQ